MRRFLATTLLFIVYLAAAKAGLSLASVHPNATAVWPPTGIAIAACLFLGIRDAVPAILAAAFVANITTAGSLATSAAIATGNALEAALGALLVANYAGGRYLVARVPDIFRFGAIAFVVTPVS